MAPQVESVSAFGRIFERYKRLAEEVVNQGGDEETLAKILKDPVALREAARKLVGKVWHFVGYPVELNVDWETPQKKLIESVGINFLPAFELQAPDTRYYTEDRPAGKRNYMLVHSERTIIAEELLMSVCGEAAGFRELLAFVEKYDVGPCRIAALASTLTTKLPIGTTVCPVFERLESDLAAPWARPGRIKNHWFKGMPKIFGPEWFFLFRIMTPC